MKQAERQHLRDNELAIALGQANAWRTRHQRTVLMAVGAVALLAIIVVAVMVWRGNADTQARARLAEAMVTYEARVVPPPVADPAGNASPAAPATAPAPNTFPSERAKLDAALPKLLAAADAYPDSDPGQTARYHAASVLVSLGRFDEAIAQYDRVSREQSGLLGQMAALGRAEAQLRAANYDAAIGAFKELSERAATNLPKEALLMELARAYRLAGKNDEARKTLTQIVEQHADSPFATDAKVELERITG